MDGGPGGRLPGLVADDRLWPVYETILGAGLRRGEALALRWSDVNLEGRTLHVRRTLSRVKGKGLVFTSPKTRGSLAGVGLSPRVVLALTAQRARQEAERAEWGEVYQDGGLVFAREDGRPYDPQWVLDQFYELSNAAGLRPVHIHDLRHLSMTLMLINGVPLPLASKVARHSKVSITADLYAHLTPEASTAAVDAAAAALDAARAVHQVIPVRPHCDHRGAIMDAYGRLRSRFAGRLGGAEGIRTPDPLTASQVRYQLRHSPVASKPTRVRPAAFNWASQGTALRRGRAGGAGPRSAPSSPC